MQWKQEDWLIYWQIIASTATLSRCGSATAAATRQKAQKPASLGTKGVSEEDECERVLSWFLQRLNNHPWRLTQHLDTFLGLDIISFQLRLVFIQCADFFFMMRLWIVPAAAYEKVNSRLVNIQYIDLYLPWMYGFVLQQDIY